MFSFSVLPRTKKYIYRISYTYFVLCTCFQFGRVKNIVPKGDTSVSSQEDRNYNLNSRRDRAVDYIRSEYKWHDIKLRKRNVRTVLVSTSRNGRNWIETLGGYFECCFIFFICFLHRNLGKLFCVRK